jgi:hypothetical protein
MKNKFQAPEAVLTDDGNQVANWVVWYLNERAKCEQLLGDTNRSLVLKKIAETLDDKFYIARHIS